MLLSYFLALFFLAGFFNCQGELLAWYNYACYHNVLGEAYEDDYDDDYEDSGSGDGDEYSGSGDDYDYDYEYGEQNSGAGDEYEYQTKYYYIPYCKKHKE